MNKRHPVRVGFRYIFQNPVFLLAEVVSRWTFGAGTLLLVLFSLLLRLDSLPARQSDMAGVVGSVSPKFLFIFAALHFFGGDFIPRTTLILLPAISILWIVTASLGRAAILGSIFQSQRLHLGSIFALNFFRAGTWLTLPLAIACIFIVVSHANGRGESTRSDWQGLVVMGFVVLVALTVSALNRYLTIAALFVARDQSDCFSAISQTLRFCVAESRKLLFSNCVFGTLRLLAVIVFLGGAIVLATNAAKSSLMLSAGYLVAGTMTYFVSAALLRLAHLGTYLAIAGTEYRR